MSATSVCGMPGLAAQWIACVWPSKQVLELEDVVQDEASRRRMRVLGHLPLTATFRLCEVDLSGETTLVAAQ